MIRYCIEHSVVKKEAVDLLETYSALLPVGQKHGSLSLQQIFAHQHKTST